MVKGVLLPALLFLVVNSAQGAVAIDATASGDQGTASTTVTTNPFSTVSGNEVLLAFIATDGVSSGAMTVSSVAGAGLTWVLVVRTNVQRGTSEIWRAFASSPLSNVTVTATLASSVGASSLTVMSFSGLDTTGTNGSGAIGATGSGNASSGAPTARLVTTRNNSWVLGVGNDYDNAIARTLGAGQTLVHQYLAPVGDTYWVQRQNGPTPLSGTSVTINDTAPTGDRYNLSIVEILPAPSGGGSTFSISGAISPATSGVGTLLTLNGAASATVTADSSANYIFTGLVNGTYTVTPSKTGFTFNPANQLVTINGGDQPNINFTASPTPTWSISGTISPATSGITVTLSGAASATVTADAASGNYSFSGLANGPYTVTPSKSGFTFSPANQSVTINGGNQPGVNFTAQSTAQDKYPDLRDIIPTGAISIVGTGSSRQFQYTHDTFNGGPGPLVIKPVYSPASGNYQGTQYIYSLSSSGVWSLDKTIPVAGVFIFDSDHGHFHFPFVTYGLYAVGANGGPGTPVATSGKISFCINDSFIYDRTLPNAGALGNLGSCSDPTSLRGLDIGAVDEYDRTDAGQSISIAGVPDGTYWLKALVDPNNYLAEGDKTNNETDVELTITGNTVQVLKTVTPVLNIPPSISITSPSDGATISRTVQLTASTAMTSGVQFLIDGQAFGNVISAAPFAISWDTTTVPNGTHWLAAQTTDPTGIIGTSAVVLVTVSNTVSTAPSVQLTSPATGSILSATVTLYAIVASNQPIASVAFYVDYAPVGTPVTSPPYMISWDSTAVTDGQHVVTASATDTLGVVGNSVPLSVTVDNSHAANLIGKEVSIFVDGQGTMQTPPFSTSTPSDLLVAFVAYDGSSSSAQTASVSGAGLTWTLLERSNTQAGTSEIWSARADGTLSAVTVSSRPGSGTGYHGSLTLIAFTNAAGTSVVGRTGAPSGAPDIPLPGVIAGDWIFAVGNDWDNAIARVPVSGQVLVHQRVDTQVRDTYWVQSTVAPSTANALVDIHDSSPTSDRWNYAAVEIVATHH